MSIGWDIAKAVESPQFGVQYDWNNAVDDIYYGNLTLYTAGCQVGKGNDCFAACQDTQKLWNDEYSPYTLYNCLAYPVIAQILHESNISEAGFKNAEQFGIRNDSSSPLFDKHPGITACIDQYCDLNAQKASFCNSTFNDTYNGNGTLTVLSDGHGIVQEFLWDFNPFLCDGLNAEINPDIGGIGVLTSYIMQVGIVTIAWLLYHIGEDWVFYVAFVFYRIKRSSTPLESARNDQDKIKGVKMFEALPKNISEFQKAQVWLMLAVQIAAMIALNNPDYFDASTWQQQRNNLGIFYDLALGGLFPILIIQIVLRQMKKLEGYLLLMSTICVALSAGTWFVTAKPAPGYQPKELTHNGPPACAGVVPMAVCYRSDWFAKSAALEERGLAMVIFCLIVQVCILLDRLRILSHDFYGQRRNVFDFLRDRWFGKKPQHQTSNEDLAKWVRPTGFESGWARARLVGLLIVFATEVALVAFTLRQLKDFARVFSTSKDQDYVTVNTHSWKLGQIIAVAVFVPPLVEYIWDCHRGVAKTIEQRILPENYKIVKKQDAYSAVPTGRKTASSISSTNTSWSLRPLKSAHTYEPLRQAH